MSYTILMIRSWLINTWEGVTLNFVNTNSLVDVTKNYLK